MMIELYYSKLSTLNGKCHHTGFVVIYLYNCMYFLVVRMMMVIVSRCFIFKCPHDDNPDGGDDDDDDKVDDHCLSSCHLPSLHRGPHFHQPKCLHQPLHP